MAAISIVQRGNLKSLEKTLRKQWRLGQNIVLCWCSDERGLLVIFVPHYFLGNYCATGDSGGGADNEAYIRRLISGKRRMSREQLFEIAARLKVSPTFIKLDSPLEDLPEVNGAVEQIIRRYGLSYVESRAVLLFDISEFSLFTPFEQASQLNSLSYSMNSAYNKLLSCGIEINFARTTTGDGYYVWNRDEQPRASRNLFYFLVLTLIDNALARAASRGNTVPVIRAVFDIGSHYELYQAEGVNPTVFSYIVGDVTIDLARLIERTRPGQTLVGDFQLEGTSGGMLDTPAFIAECSEQAGILDGIKISNRPLSSMQFALSTGAGESAPTRLNVTDKHGLRHRAYNLEMSLTLGEETLRLGLSGSQAL